jgi:hypothetical protein
VALLARDTPPMARGARFIVFWCILGLFRTAVRAIGGPGSRRLRHPLAQRYTNVPTCLMFGAVGGYRASLVPIPKLDVAGSSPVARSRKMKLDSYLCGPRSV